MDINFSGGEVAAVIGLLGAMASGMGILYKSLQSSYDGRLKAEEDENAYLREEIGRVRAEAERREAQWRDIALNGTVIAAKAVDTLAKEKTP